MLKPIPTSGALSFWLIKEHLGVDMLPVNTTTDRCNRPTYYHMYTGTHSYRCHVEQNGTLDSICPCRHTSVAMVMLLAA